jgi:hypothetical protein
MKFRFGVVVALGLFPPVVMAMPPATHQMATKLIESGMLEQALESFSRENSFYTSVLIENSGRVDESICGEMTFSRSFGGIVVTIRRYLNSSFSSQQSLTKKYYFGTAGSLESLTFCRETD